MKPDSQNFEGLRQLMALKRHEQPPPGYFDLLARDVRARILAGERGIDSEEGSWLQRFWAAVEARPAFAGAFGVAVCGVLLAGILNSEDAGIASGSGISQASVQSPVPYASAPSPMAFNAGTASQNLLGTNNTNPMEALFDDIRLKAQPASVNFTLPAGN